MLSEPNTPDDMAGFDQLSPPGFAGAVTVGGATGNPKSRRRKGVAPPPPELEEAINTVWL
ncbi:hypothetical protein [Asticcacaulis machinosus]|uniref:Uncharacterized protein n=1 Tax=Asticcacaulis machinosus TaxID=2984211 RepID=A0ABT5HH29_9CAUL|nr:hypothetical protein [Asticcacaulis machinosus]MDC7675560.1 hypothetical protein [Asticcacaulis machinosus]